jgi:hypothetical protein
MELTGDRTEIERWCRMHLDRGLDPPRTEITVIFPAITDVWPDGTVLVGPDNLLIVEIDSADRSPADRLVAVRNEATGAVDNRYLGSNLLPIQVYAGHLPLGSYSVLVRERTRQSAPLPIRVVAPPAAPVPDARLRVRHAGEGLEASYHWFEPEANRLLADARRGRATLLELNYPGDYPVLGPQSKPQNSADWLRWLATGQGPVWLDAGPFGRLDADTDGKDPATVDLPLSLAARLRWLCAARAARRGTRTVAAPWSDGDRQVASQAALGLRVAREFLAATDWPVELAAHVRVAWRELARLLQT